MAEAEAAAGALVPAAGNAQGLIPATPANTNVALARPSVDSFVDGGGMDVDEYLKVKPEGFRIGDTMQGLLDELDVEIDLTEVVPIYSFRVEVGGQIKFLKSYDGVTTHDGKNFSAECDRLTRVGDKPSGVYDSIEIPMELLTDVADTKKGSSVVIEAGTRVGYTPSITGVKPFRKFMKKLRQADPNSIHNTINVRVTHEKRTKNSFEWGVLNFAPIEG
jgi:hypothetical protein